MRNVVGINIRSARALSDRFFSGRRCIVGIEDRKGRSIIHGEFGWVGNELDLR